MNKIAVFFTEHGAMSYPFTSQEYWQSYQELDAEINSIGGQLYITRGQDSYQGAGCFSQSWRFHNRELIECGPIKVDLLFDKGNFTATDDVAVFNNQQINNICTNKWLMYQLFPELCPKTFLISNIKEFQDKIIQIPSELKVIKPIDGEEGKDVFIGNSSEVLDRPIKFPFIIQEFIDSHHGIPSITPSTHDFRIALINGEVVYSFVRTPPPKSLLANVALGGTLTVIKPDDIPIDAINIGKKVDSLMKRYGDRFYGIDMALSPSGFKIIELNSKLGLQQNSRHPVFIQLKKKLAQLLVKIASKHS